MDVMGSYFSGLAAGQSRLAHQEAMEDSKLRRLIYRHQLAKLDIEDKLRQREFAKQHLALLEGLPEAQMPTEPIQQPNLPSTSHAGAMTGLPGVVSSMGQDQAPVPPPSTLPAPGAQAAELGTNMTTRRQGVTFGAIPEMGIPSATVQPRSMEELMRASILAKLNEPFNLGPGQRRFVGGRMVAEGGEREPTTASLAVKAASGDEAAGKAVNLLRPSSQQPANAQQKDVLLDGQPTPVLLDPRTRKYTDLDGNEITNAAKRIRLIPPQDRASRDPGVAAKRDYDTFYRLYERTYPAQKNSDMALLARALAGKGGSEASKEPPPRPAPSFEKWKVMTPAERQRVLANPDDRIDDAQMLRRLEVPAAVQSILRGKATNRYILTDGSVWDVLPDGTIHRGPRP